MSLRPSERAEVRRSRYKVAVDAEEGRRRREDNMVEIRKSRREESLLKKRRDSLPPSAAAAPCSSSSGSWCCIWGRSRQADSTVDLHQRVALCQQCPTLGEHHRLCAQRRCVCVVLPAAGLQRDLHMRHRRVQDGHRDQGHGGEVLAQGDLRQVCTGAKSEQQSKLAARKYARIIQKLGFPAKFKDFKVQNIVGSCDVKIPIRLEGLAYSHGASSSYEPKLFPGLIYQMKQPKIVLLIFVSGNIVLTGAKVRDETYTAFENIYPVLTEFRKVQQWSKLETPTGC